MTDLERRLARAPSAALDLARVNEELSRRAGEAGLLDVAYGTVDSPVGRLTVYVTPRGLVRLRYPEEPEQEVMADLASDVSPRILSAPHRTDTVRRELDEYFAGRRHGFDLTLDWRLVRGFASGVLHATARIPFGSVASYGEVAAEAGSPRAARAAGNALHGNPIPIVVPCHRVLPADHSLGGYGGGPDRKRYLLTLEGALPRP